MYLVSRRREKESKKLNFCIRFILPMVGINYKTLPDELINCYIDEEYHTYLVFEKNENFEKLLDNYFNHIKNTNNFLVLYEEDTDEVTFKFKIPSQFEKDFDLFIDGSYSKLSDILKDRLCLYFGKKTIQANHEVSIYNAIYPQDFKRKQIAYRVGEDVKYIIEVLDKPNLQEELYKPLTALITNKYEQTI